ncbi:MAG: amidohydrolase [Oscillospiraceae bacterium]|nr:amidohydrolase [Oscillospiraceae bacterium]
MLIDFHTHAFPERIAQRAVMGLSHGCGGVVPETDGTLAGLKEKMDMDGVDISVVLSIATNPKQQTNVNNFAIEVNRDDRIVAFGSVHPDAPDALEELERIAAAGLKGVKFHPEYQNFYANDEKMKPIYRKISQLGLITTFHAGHDNGFAPPYHGMAEHLLGAKRWLDTPVVAAHWGGMGNGAEVINQLCGEDLWFDLSLGYNHVPKPVAQAIVEKHGTDRLLFASDMPWQRVQWELRLIESLGLSEEDKEKIFFRNARKLLNL